MKIYKFALMSTAAFVALSAQGAQAQQSGGADEETAVDSNMAADPIIVTARRTAEDIQKVPVSITALGNAQLRAAGITKVSEIANVVPGLNLFFNGSETNTIYSIRGMSRGSLGFQQPAVTTYVNDVPTTVYGAAMPTYDLANVQVLKGPQGTLFGRNSEAGAILTNTQAPTYDWNGYADLLVGSYSWMKAEGAVNIPVIADKFAIRLAGNVNRREGYQKNLTFRDSDYANINNDAFRVSVLVEPFEGLKNVFVYEYYSSSTNGVSPTLLTYNPAAPGLPNGTPFQGPFAQNFADQQAAGPRAAFAPYRMPAVDKRDVLSNTTTLELGDVTIKNIIGYNKNFVSAYVNQTGTAFPLIPGYRFIDYRQVTEELQLSGKAFDNALTYIVGGFYLDYRPSGTSFELVAPPGTSNFENPIDPDGPGPAPALPLGAGNYYRDKSKSAYGQVNLDFGAISPALEGLSIDAGLRYSKDNHYVCSIGGQLPSTAASESTCLQTAANKASSKEDFWSYTLGVNYEISSQVLVYGVTRRGYRAGGLNAPILGGTLAAAGGQSFRPETVTDYELGLKSRFELGGVPVTFNAAVFQADYKDLQYSVNTNGVNQVLGPNGPPPFGNTGGVDGDFNDANNPTALYYSNVGAGRVKGLEAALSIQPVSSLQLSGGLSILDFNVTSNTYNVPANFPPFLVPGIANFRNTVFYGAPKISYNGSVNYTLPLPSDAGEMIVRAKVNGSGTIQYDGLVVPPKAVLDLRLDWNSVMGTDVDLSVFATNVTNKLFVGSPNLGSPGAFSFTSGTYNEPRMIGVQARWHFGPQ